MMMTATTTMMVVMMMKHTIAKSRMKLGTIGLSLTIIQLKLYLEMT
jgi:hypothetical protein